MTALTRRLGVGWSWRRHPLPVALAAIAAAALVGLVLCLIAGAGPGQTISALVEGTVGTPFAIGTSLNAASVLILIAGGFTIAFRAGLVNVGGEGQLAAGGVAAAAVGTTLGAGTPAVIALPAVLAAGAAGGALWAAIAAYLRVRRDASEIITTLLLNFVGLALITLMVNEPSLLRQPQTSSETLPQSSPLIDSAHIPLLGLDSSPTTVALLLALAVVLALGIVLRQTATGLRLRTVGLSPSAASRLGMPVARHLFVSLTTAGALAGLAGGVLIATSPFVLVEGFTSGYGFTGLVVGLLARGSMLAVIAVSLLLAFLTSGGINLQLVAGVPSSTVTIVAALITIFIAGAAAQGAMTNFSRRPTPAPTPGPAASAPTGA